MIIINVIAFQLLDSRLHGNDNNVIADGNGYRHRLFSNGFIIIIMSIDNRNENLENSQNIAKISPNNGVNLLHRNSDNRLQRRRQLQLSPSNGWSAKPGQFRLILGILVLAELLSIFAWRIPVFDMVCFSVLCVLVFLLALERLEYGIYIAAAELIIGSYGYLFSLDLAGSGTLISIRMGIFGAVMLAWVIKVLREGGLGQCWQRLRAFRFFK